MTPKTSSFLFSGGTKMEQSREIKLNSSKCPVKIIKRQLLHFNLRNILSITDTFLSCLIFQHTVFKSIAFKHRVVPGK